MSIYIKRDERGDARSWMVTILPDDKEADPWFVEVDDDFDEAMRVATTIVAEHAHVGVYIEPKDAWLRETGDLLIEVALKEAGGLQ